MKRISTLYTAAALLLAATACNNAGLSSDDTVAFKAVTSEKTYRLAGTAKDYETENDLNFQCKASLQLPIALMGKDVKTLNRAIFKTAFDTTGTDTQALMFDNFKSVMTEGSFTPADTTADPEFTDGFYILTGTLANLDEKHLSYSVQKSVEYPRMAHPMYSTIYINYDIDKGEIIELTDLFTPEGLKALPAILKEKAKEMSDYFGPTNIEALPSDNNFYISANNGDLVFSYGIYEVASYAQGEIEVPVPPYFVAEYLTPYGKKLLLNYEE